MRAALLLTATLLVSPAYAQTQNSQLQLRGVSADTEVEVGGAYDVGAAAVATGNVITHVTDDDVALQNRQHMDGDAHAEIGVTIWNADGVVSANAAAAANAGTLVSEDSDVDVRSLQLAHGDTSAATRVVTGDAGDVAASGSAAGNVGAISAENGQVRAILEQESTGSVSTDVEADLCCIAGQAVAGAVASANNLAIAGDTATVLTDTRQHGEGEVRARTDLYAGYTTDAVANSTANTNSLTIDNQWGYVNAQAEQTADADVGADAYVTLGGDFIGFATAGAYGVGNAVTISNIGSDTDVDVSQDNSGDISANAAMLGEGGDMALASAAAYGNTMTASLCGYCDTNSAALRGENTQVNSGDVQANATVNAPRARHVAATANAIGNAATFQSVGPGQ